MTPRQPPESPDDDKQRDLLQAVHNALNNITPVTEQPVPEMEQDAPHLVKAEDVDVEIDRIEAYLRGPTAFTA